MCFLAVCTLSSSIAQTGKYGLKTVSSMKEYRESVLLDPNQAILALDTIPGIKLDVRYATTNNFMHRRMYTRSAAFLRKPAADSLRVIAKELSKAGLGLCIYDGYRPYRVTIDFYEAYPDTTFVASPYNGSRHNRGCAVDLTLYELRTGKALKMPTSYDSFDKKAAADYMNISKETLKNRKLLQDIMLKHGFAIYASEWWHFDFKGWKAYPVTDLSFEDLLNN